MAEMQSRPVMPTIEDDDHEDYPQPSSSKGEAQNSLQRSMSAGEAVSGTHDF